MLLKVFQKTVANPSEIASIVKAQLMLGRRARVPLSVRLRGRAQVEGRGVVAFERGVCLSGTIVPIEFNTYAAGRIEIGAHTFVNYGSSFSAHDLVRIGAHCHLGHYTFVMDNNQHDIIRHAQVPPSERVIIDDHVWIGSHVIILPGVHIGSYAVIGAGSVVTKDVPSHCLVAGNPARVIRHLERVS